MRETLRETMEETALGVLYSKRFLSEWELEEGA